MDGTPNPSIDHHRAGNSGHGLRNFALGALTLLLGCLPACTVTAGGADSGGGDPDGGTEAKPHVRLRSTSVLDRRDGSTSRIHFVDGGPEDATDAVLLVHGLGLDHTAFRAQLATWLPTGRRVLALDLPGHGKSELPAGPLHLELLQASLRAVLDAAEIERVVLVGQGLGVPLVCAFAAASPRRCRAILALEGEVVPIIGPVVRAEAAAAFAELPPGDRAAAFRAGAAADLPEVLVDDLAGRVADTPPRALQEYGAAIADPECWPEAALDVPVELLVSGAEHWTAAVRRAARQRAPQLRWSRLRDAGHLLFLEQPEAVTAALERVDPIATSHGP